MQNGEMSRRMNFELQKAQLKTELEQNAYCRRLLYRRGYLLTDRDDLALNDYPFYGNWEKYPINEKFYAYLHKDAGRFNLCKRDHTTAVLIGHAYNPFTMQINESEILDDCISNYKEGGIEKFLEKVSELSGIHVIALFTPQEAFFVQDCTAMKACYYGKCGGNIYVLSHCALLQDIAEPTINTFADKLIHSFAYQNLGSSYLPGDITVFRELNRLGPNVFMAYNEEKGFSVERFFPTSNHPVKNDDEVDTINLIAETIKNSVALCANKWARPAISLSGGMDSRTTFSAANGNYDKFQFYSFYCKPQELEDANAAHSICAAVGVPHRIYPISENNSDYPDFELHKKIIARNSAYVSIPKDHEIRKYIFLSQLNDFDVELKSWASEIGRAYWERRYCVKLPDKLTPRHFSIFQTRFIAAPILLRKNDAAYREYLKKSKFIYPMFNYEHTDMFYWEYRFGSNGTNVTMGQDIFNFQVTMPMNNRKLMDMFLWYSHDFRKNDRVHKAVILKNEPKFKDIKNEVHNGYFAGKRILFEKLYYRYRTLFRRTK